MGSIFLGLALAEAGMVKSRCLYLVQEESNDGGGKDRARCQSVQESLCCMEDWMVEYLRGLLRESHEEMCMKAGQVK